MDFTKAWPLGWSLHKLEDSTQTPSDQFYCRALFAKALVESDRARTLEGLRKVEQVQHALTYVLEALDERHGVPSEWAVGHALACVMAVHALVDRARKGLQLAACSNIQRAPIASTIPLALKGRGAIL